MYTVNTSTNQIIGSNVRLGTEMPVGTINKYMPAVQYRDGGNIYGNLTIHGSLSARVLNGGGSGPYTTGAGTNSIVGNSALSNSASGNYSTISNGVSGIAAGPYSLIGNGYNNVINSDGTDFTIILNGGSNTILPLDAGSDVGQATIINGQENTVRKAYATVINGFQNTASGYYSTVINGSNLSATHDHSTVVGTDIKSVSASMLHVNRLYAKDLPTSNPGVAGVIWNDAGTLKISI